MAETTVEHEHETSSRSRKARGREVVTRRDDVMLSRAEDEKMQLRNLSEWIGLGERKMRRCNYAT